MNKLYSSRLLYSHVVSCHFLNKAFLPISILVLCSYLIGCKADKRAIVEGMIEYGAYEGMYMGPTDSISPQWRYYEALVEEFSERELIELCNHKNPIVRCYAFKALTEKGSSEVYNVLVQHLSDTTEFDRIYGCFPATDRVVDNFLDEVGYNKNRQSKFTLEDEQYKKIDSFLLCQDKIKQRTWLGSIEHRSCRYMLERIRPKPEYYRRIKEIVDEGVYEALSVLAQYENPDDTATFKKLLHDDEFSNKGRILKIYVRKSIKFFPHPAFYPILKDQLMKEIGTNAIYDEIESYPLYTALVQYPTKETRALFETALKNSGKEYEARFRFISCAIKQCPSNIFDDLVLEKVEERLQ